MGFRHIRIVRHAAIRRREVGVIIRPTSTAGEGVPLRSATMAGAGSNCTPHAASGDGELTRLGAGRTVV